MADLSVYDPIFKAAGEEWNVHPLLLKAIASQESAGDARAVSPKNAQGLMQIIPDTQRYLGVTNPNDPAQSIYGAAKYMSEALDAEGSPEHALLYYHGGRDWRQAYGPESRGYVPAVTAQYVKLARASQAAAPQAPAKSAAAAPAANPDIDPKTGLVDPAGNLSPGTAAPAPAASAEAGKAMPERKDDDYSDFLKRTGATGGDAAAGKEPDYGDFLKRTGAAPSGTPQATTAQAVPTAGPSLPAVDDLGRPIPDGSPATSAPLPGQDAVNRIIDAGVQGYRGTEPILTPKGEAAVSSWAPGGLPVGSAIVVPATKIAGAALGGINALASAGAHGVMEATEPLPEGARLGRDINQLLQVAPVAGIPGMAGPAGVRPPIEVTSPLRPPDVPAPPNPLSGVGPLTEEARARSAANPLGPKSEVPTPPPEPTTGGPQPGMGGPRLSPEDQQWVSGAKDQLAEIHAENRAAGVPGSVGAAATPEELAKLTPAQIKAYRRQAELGDILAPPERGVDTKIHVEGSEPTHAEWAGDPAVSQQETLLRQRAPKDYDERLSKNNQARVNSYESMMGTDPQVVGVREAKAKAAERDGAAFVRAAGPIDLQPALSWVDEQLASPRILEQPEIVKTLRQMRESLFDADGKLKTDPQSGWGMHDQNMTRLEKSKLDTKDERFATSQILQFKRLVDDANNKASNGAFQTFLDNQANYAQQINAMTELQKFRTRLTNNKGEINAPAFHKFVTDLAMRRGKAGVDAAMDISDATMRGLIDIDKDLKRASNIDLGKARGSGTNLFGALAQSLGLGAAHLGMAAATTGPVGNLLLQGAANTVGKLTGNALLNRKVRKGLAPPPGGYTYNELGPD
jgi:hypothetical protein